MDINGYSWILMDHILLFFPNQPYIAITLCRYGLGYNRGISYDINIPKCNITSHILITQNEDLIG